MVKNPPANAGDTGLIPGLRDPTCSGVTKPQLLNLCSRAWKPQLLSQMPQLLKPVCPNVCTLQLESSPRSPQLERRVRAQPNKKLKIKFKKVFSLTTNRILSEFILLNRWSVTS